MVVKVKFNNQDYEFPDGMSDEDIYASLNKQQEGGNTPTDQGYGFGEGGIGGSLSAAKSGLQASMLNIAGAIADNPDLSRYSARQALKYSQQAIEKEHTLGTTGRFIAGAGKYAPAIAAGMVNPYAGAAVGGTLVTGDVLGSQYAETGEYNAPRAVAAGTLAGIADIASMGLASKLPVRGLASRIGANAVEDTGSGVGYQAATNWGEKKDVTSNLGEAALMSAAGGMALRGTAKAGGKVLNIGGEKATKDLTDVFKDTVNPNTASSYIDYHNKQQDYFDKTTSGTVKDAEQASNEMHDTSFYEGSVPAAMEAFRSLQEYGLKLNDRALDINFGTQFDGKGTQFNLGKDVFGTTYKQMSKAGLVEESAIPSLFNTSKAQEAGLTATSSRRHNQRMAESFFRDKERILSDNKAYIDNQIKTLGKNADPVLLQKYKDLSESLGVLKTEGSRYIFDKKAPIEALTGSAKRASKLAIDLGEIGNLKGFNEKPGSWNPLQDLNLTNKAYQIVLTQMPTYRHGVFDPTVEAASLSNATSGTADVALVASGKGFLIPAKKGAGLLYRGLKGAYSQKQLAKQKAITQERAKQIAELQGKVKKPTKPGDTPPPTPTKADEAIQKSLQEGDSFKATEQAAADLEQQGIPMPGMRDQNAVESVSEPLNKARSKLTPDKPTKKVEEPAVVEEIVIPKKKTDSKFVKPAIKPEPKIEEPTVVEPVKVEESTTVEPIKTEEPAPKKKKDINITRPKNRDKNAYVTLSKLIALDTGASPQFVKDVIDELGGFHEVRLQLGDQAEAGIKQAVVSRMKAKIEPVNKGNTEKVNIRSLSKPVVKPSKKVEEPTVVEPVKIEEPAPKKKKDINITRPKNRDRSAYATVSKSVASETGASPQFVKDVIDELGGFHDIRLQEGDQAEALIKLAVGLRMETKIEPVNRGNTEKVNIRSLSKPVVKPSKKVEEPTVVEPVKTEEPDVIIEEYSPKKKTDSKFVKPAIKPTKKTEESVVVEEPVVSTEAKIEEPSTTPLKRSTSNSYELVRQPLISKIEELQNVPMGPKRTSNNELLHKTQADLKFFETVVNQLSREIKVDGKHVDKNYITDVIKDMGGISEIRGGFGSESKAEIKAAVKDKLSTDKETMLAEKKAQEEAAIELDKAKTEVIEEKANKIIEDAKTKAKKDKEDKLIEEFRKTYINKGVHHSTVDAALKKGKLEDGTFSAKAAKAAIDTAVKNAAKKSLESAPKPMTHSEAKSLMDDFVGDNYSIKSVKSAVDDVFRNVTGKDPAPSISTLRSLQNKVLKLIQAEADKADKLAKSESDAYDAWVANADNRLQTELDAKSEALGKKISSAEKALKKAREEADAEQKRYDEYWEKGNTANPVEITKAKMMLRSKQSTVETITETINNLGNDRKKLDEILSKPRTTDPVEEAFYKARIAKATKASKEFREVEKKMQQKLKSQEKEISEKARVLDQISETNKLTQNILSTPEVKIQEQVESLQTISKDFEEATLKALEDSPKGTEEVLASKINDLSKIEQGSSSESLARVAGIMKAVAKRSEDPLVQKSMNKFSEILAKSAEMKKKYPNNPETWVSRDDYDTLKEVKFGDKLSSYAGSIGTNLTIGIYGSKHRPDTLLSGEEIGKISRALDTGIKKGIMSKELKEKVKGKGGVRKIATDDKDIKVVVRKIKK